MMEAGRHPNIELLTMSEAVALDGEPGNFTATVLRHPRYVDESLCTGCGDCIVKCPYKAADAFEMGLATRKAIYIYFPQGIPACAVIDAESCQYFKTGKCRICEKVCRRQAVNFRDSEKKMELKVDAVIVATGFEPYDVSNLQEYGFGKLKNVITGLQYERMISASGPTGGELARPSDSRAPKRIAFIQCVGSRDERNRPYCSTVCCMHATKQAILAAEHYPGARLSIFYTDMRSPGKGFQEYVNRAKVEHGVRYIRSRPGKLLENKETGDVTVFFDDMESRSVGKAEFDMVVLCHALIPEKSNSRLGQALGIDLDEYGFVRNADPMALSCRTSRPGVFACGFCAEPQDIPDSVVQASAAAACVAELLTNDKGQKKNAKCKLQNAN
jgi:heterodisulfide reductase subunit A